MKSVFAALLVFAAINAEARSIRLDDTTTLPEGAVSITSVAGKVESTSPLCPVGAECFVGGTVLNLSFTGGCVDQLLPIAYVVNGNEVYVHAQIVHNENATRVFCLVA